MSDGDRSGFVTLVYFWQVVNGLKNQIANIPSGGGSLTAVRFTGTSFSNSALIGKTPDEQFLVFSDEGSGTLQYEGDGYTFDSGTGTITVPSGDWRVVY